MTYSTVTIEPPMFQRVGLLLTQFPNQTSISMYRVGVAMRELGVSVDILSTRQADADARCHPELSHEAKNTFYAWPASIVRVCRRMTCHPWGLIKSARYLRRLNQSSWKERLRLLPIWVAGSSLAEHCRRQGIEHVLVHSCADAAHLINFAKAMGGPRFSLRLGGDLEVYGKDHQAKMAAATMVFPAARINQTQVEEEIGLPQESLLWTPLGVDSRRFVPTERQSKPGVQVPLRLVTVARLNPAKGHSHAIAAVAELRRRGVSIHYSIAGGGPYEVELKRQVADLQVMDCVDFLGPLGESQIIALLQSADVFLLPSTGIGEASPVAVIEAMSCGLVVVSSEIGGTPDLLRSGIEGKLVPPGDVAAIADAVQELAQDSTARARLGKAARLRVESDFDCSQVAKRMLIAIRERASQ